MTFIVVPIFKPVWLISYSSLTGEKNSSVVDDDFLVVEHDSTMVDDSSSVVVEHDSMMVDDDSSVVVEHDSTMMEGERLSVEDALEENNLGLFFDARSVDE